MRRILAVVLCAIIVFMLTSCSRSETNNNKSLDETTLVNSDNDTSVASDKKSGSNKEEPTEAAKSKKTIETWAGGVDNGYISKIEEFDINNEPTKTMKYNKQNKTMVTTFLWERQDTTNGKSVTEIEYNLDGSQKSKTVEKYNLDNRIIQKDTYKSDDTISESETYEYNSDGKILKKSLHKDFGEFGEETTDFSYEYNAKNLLVKEISTITNINYQGSESNSSSIKVYEYDTYDNKVKELYNDNISSEWKYDYDENGKIISKWEKDSSDNDFRLIEKYEYKQDGTLYQKIKYNSDGLSVTYIYNEKEVLIEEYGNPSSADESMHKYYNDKGLIIKETGTTNHTKTTTYEYNENDDMIKKTISDDWDGGSSNLTEYVITYWN